MRRGSFSGFFLQGKSTNENTRAHQVFRPNALEWAFGVNMDCILKPEKTGESTYWEEAGGVLILE